MKNRIRAAGLLLSVAALSALAAQPATGAGMAGMQHEVKTGQVRHQGTGRVVAVDRAKLSIRLAHEAIKSLGWPGMTMEFKVASSTLLDGLNAGDAVTFELVKDAPSGKWLITGIAPAAVR